MPRDIFVYFEKMPEKGELETLLKRYVGGAATEVKFDAGRWFATLHGSNSNPVLDFEKKGYASNVPYREGERWFEVYLADNNIDVMTREQDPFTNDVAKGFAELMARLYHGRLKE